MRYKYIGDGPLPFVRGAKIVSGQYEVSDEIVLDPALFEPVKKKVAKRPQKSSETEGEDNG